MMAPFELIYSVSFATRKLFEISGNSSGTPPDAFAWHVLSAEPDAVVVIPGRRVRQNNLIPLAQTLHNCDRAHGATTEHHRSAQSFLAIRRNAKHAHGRLALTERR